MGKSSYETIYKRLLQTKTGKEEIENIRIILDSIKVVSYRFTETTRDGLFSFDTIWIATGLSDFKKEFQKIEDFGIRYGFKGQLIDIKLIVERHFGKHKDVKTINCNPEIITGSISSKKHDAFRTWFIHQFSDMFEQETKAACERMTAKTQELAATSEFAERKALFIKDCALTAIRNTLKKYEFLGDEFLSDSIRDYVAHSILES